MKTKHTPTPWVTANGVNILKIADPERGNALLATLEQSHVGVDEAVANAAFIVRACNSHDELVSALNEAQQYLHDMLYAGVLKNDGSHNLHIINTTIAQALAKAKGAA